MYSDEFPSRDQRLYRELAFSFYALEKAEREFRKAQARYNKALLDFQQSGQVVPNTLLREK